MSRRGTVGASVALGLVGLTCLWGLSAQGDDPKDKDQPTVAKGKAQVNRKAIDRLLGPPEAKPEPAPPKPAVKDDPKPPDDPKPDQGEMAKDAPKPKAQAKSNDQPKAKTAAKKAFAKKKSAPNGDTTAKAKGDAEPKKAEATAKAKDAESKKGDATAKSKADPSKPIDLRSFGRPERTVKAPTLTSAEIDERITKIVNESGMKPVERTSDDEFIRRVTIDLIGTLPSPVQMSRFRSGGPGKREKLIDDLLASPRFGENWASYWRDVIATRATNQNPGRLEGYKDLEKWLADRLNEDRPWDEIATRLITASGKINEEGATGLMLAHVDGGKVVEVEIAGEVARVFLGIQIQCAQCHDHPSDQWKREQFHGFAAFFAGVRAKAGGMQEPEVENAPRTTYAMPDLKDPTKRVPVAPRFFLDTSEGTIPRDATPELRRALAASFVTGQDDPWFARAFINRVWTLLIGEGFYTPIDDLGPTREAKASEILDELAHQWASGGYDVKWLFRTLMNTQAYQRRVRSTFSEAGRTSFAANTVSRMRGEQIVDALEDSLGVKLGGPGGRMALRGPKALFHADPSMPYDEVQPTIPQALFLMNDPRVQAGITGKNNVAAQVLKIAPNDVFAMEAIYLRILARHPTKAEAKVLDGYLRNHPNRIEAYEDLVWALVNSAEFQCRH
jgi:hypothetical protein